MSIHFPTVGKWNYGIDRSMPTFSSSAVKEMAASSSGTRVVGSGRVPAPGPGISALGQTLSSGPARGSAPQSGNLPKGAESGQQSPVFWLYEWRLPDLFRVPARYDTWE